MRKLDAGGDQDQGAEALRMVRLEELGERIRSSSPGASTARWRLARALVIERISCCSTSRCPISTPNVRRGGIEIRTASRRKLGSPRSCEPTTRRRPVDMADRARRH